MFLSRQFSVFLRRKEDKGAVNDLFICSENVFNTHSFLEDFLL